MTVHAWLQLIIGLGSGIAFVLHVAKWRPAAFVGLAIQPAWFAVAIRSRQWGVLAAAVVYTIGWCVAIADARPPRPPADCGDWTAAATDAGGTAE